MTRPVKVAELLLLEGYQPRVTMDLELVDEYAEQMTGGYGTFPPVEVFHVDGKLVVVDGFHRVQAARKAALKEILANVRQGNADEALLFSVKANATHGLRRSNEDKRRAVELLLDHPTFGKLGKEKIANLAGVSKPTVIDIVRRRQGEMTAPERRKAAAGQSQGVNFTLPEKLTPALKAFADLLKAAGATESVIAAALELKRQQQRPAAQRARKTPEEKLRILLEKVGKARNKVAVLTLEEATPRTKKFVKLPRL